MASPPGVTSKTLRVWTRLRVCVYVCTSDEFCEDEEDSECREVKEWASRREREQSGLRVARKRAECIESREIQEPSVKRYL